MIALLLASWLAPAHAAEHRVVRPGDTVASIAAGLGDPTLAAAIRARNGLGEREEPAVGAVLRLPALADHVDDEASVLASRGSVEIRAPGAAPRAAVVAAEVPMGATICTGEDGYATVRLAVSIESGRHDDLTMLPGTCLTIDGTSARTGSRSSLVSMRSGGIAIRSADDDTGAVTVVTDSGVTSGSAGGFRVTVEAGAARTEAIGGATTVFGAARAVELPEGFGSRTRTGEAPGDPVALLVPGSPAAPDDGAPLRRPDFDWTPVDRALGYRIEIAASPDFSDILRAEAVSRTEWRPDRLFLPYRVPGLWWRVSSIDRTGFVGKPSAIRSLVVPPALGP